ncbi:MAG: hypothetical protein Q7S21_03400 [archaeon]|nr:hypothetical protein [archaeon]
MNKLLLLVGVLALIFGGISFLSMPKNTGFASLNETEGIHLHADFAVFINNQQVDFAKPEFMTDESQKLSGKTHLHDLNGKIVHVHASNVILGMFFESIGMKFDSTCIKLSNGSQFCSKQGKSLKFFVNGIENSDFGNYEIKDLDQIVISYGSQSLEEIQSQLDTVSDEACIYSETCPERDPAPDESTCVGDECYV